MGLAAAACVPGLAPEDLPFELNLKVFLKPADAARIRMCSSKSAAGSAEKPSIILAALVDGKLSLMTTPCAVLDTNVVLDWLVFENPGVQGVAQAILSGQVRWILCAGMRAELAHVLAHARLGERQFDAEQVLTLVDHVAVAVDDPSLQALIRPRCSDASDQIFIDLALSHRVRWLLSRDRALLRLARKVASQGLLVQAPEAWQLQDGCSSSA